MVLDYVKFDTKSISFQSWRFLKIKPKLGTEVKNAKIRETKLCLTLTLWYGPVDQFNLAIMEWRGIKQGHSLILYLSQINVIFSYFNISFQKVKWKFMTQHCSTIWDLEVLWFGSKELLMVWRYYMAK